MRIASPEARRPRPTPRLADGRPVTAARGLTSLRRGDDRGVLESLLLSLIVGICALLDVAVLYVQARAAPASASLLASDPSFVSFLVLKIGVALLGCTFLATHRHIPVFRWSFRIFAGAYAGLLAAQIAQFLSAGIQNSL